MYFDVFFFFLIGLKNKIKTTIKHLICIWIDCWWVGPAGSFQSWPESVQMQDLLLLLCLKKKNIIHASKHLSTHIFVFLALENVNRLSLPWTHRWTDTGPQSQPQSPPPWPPTHQRSSQWPPVWQRQQWLAAHQLGLQQQPDQWPSPPPQGPHCPLLTVPPVQVQGHQHLTLSPNGQHAGGHALPLHTVHHLIHHSR